MRFLYKVMYGIGFTPWDTPETVVPQVLRDVIEGPRPLPAGRAIDLGCGMGRHAIFLAEHGWRVTGIDSSGRALRTARHRAEKAGLDIDFRPGDVTRIEKTGVSGPFDFFLDGGCFHGVVSPQTAIGVTAPPARAASIAESSGERRGRTARLSCR